MKERSNRLKLDFNALTYGAVLATIIVAAATYSAPLADLAGLLFPVSALLSAILLLWRKPRIYIVFSWWIWFLTPEVRRLVDYHSGYHEQSLVMLTPFLVTGVALFAVFGNLRNLAKQYRVLFAFVSFGLLYAYIVGFLNNGFIAATFDLLTWGTPVISGAYLLTHTHYAADFRRATQQTFMWGILIMGVYSIVQYFFLPAWDAYWMTNANLVSIGVAEPQQLRTFGTLNSPGPFATIMAAGLLLAFEPGSPVRAFGAAAGFIGFALSAVRAAWGGWVVGLIVVFTRLSFRLRIRLLGILILLAVVAIPLFSVGPVASLLSQRFASLSDLRNDTSFNERLALYASFSNFISYNLIGQGLGSTGVASSLSQTNTDLQSLDSGIIAVLYTFGALGTIYFVGGALTLFGIAITIGGKSRNLNDAIYIGITVGTLAQLFFGNVWGGVTGMVLWFFPCLYLALMQLRARLQAPPVINPSRIFSKRVNVYKA